MLIGIINPQAKLSPLTYFVQQNKALRVITLSLQPRAARFACLFSQVVNFYLVTLRVVSFLLNSLNFKLLDPLSSAQ